MKQNLWLFIDIDNCIMDSIFDNKFYDNDYEKIETIIKAYKKGKYKEIYKEFIEFYKRITSNEQYDIEEITFVTGRQENVMGWFTEKHLELLHDIHWFTIHYFYNFAKHTWEIYRNFKINCILDAIQYTQFRGLIKIYDDLDVSKEFKEVLDKPHEFYLIKSKEDWNAL